MLYCDEMKLIQIYFNEDSLKECINEIGKSRLVHFIDISKVKRKSQSWELDRLNARCKYLAGEIKKLEIDDVDDDGKEDFDMENMEMEVEKCCLRMRELMGIEKESAANLSVIQENYIILEETENYLGSEIDVPHIGEFRADLGYVSGIVERERYYLLEKVLDKAMRGNIIIHTADRGDKRVFLVFTHGENSLRKVQHICVSMGARTIDPFDKRIHKKEMGLLNISTLINQLKKVREDNRDVINVFGKRVAKKLASWQKKIDNEQKIANTISMIDRENSPVGQAWIRSRDLNKFKKLILHINDTHAGIAFDVIDHVNMKPPTSIPTNKYTEAFQSMTNTFGVPSHDELNPGVFNIFLIPFLFGLMFGDVGHGLLLLAASIFFIKYGKNMKSEIFEILYDGRYIMLLCSFASIYCGFLYADFFAMPFNFSGNYLHPIFGVSETWHHATNGQAFMNSMKMKLSIVVGEAHMLFGLFLAIANTVIQNDFLTLYTVVIPKIIANLCFIGYMTFFIIFKWVKNDVNISIISVIISMFTDPFNTRELYPYQKHFQIFLLSIFVITIPWSMFSKAVYRIIRREKFGDDLMHCCIDGIEYYISLLSHTSSYLRIWAVSLAHSQLALIFNSFVINASNIFLKAAFFIVWIFGSVFIILALEGMSSILHAMRLNWVEFYSKFYKCEGYLFEPLCLD
ncbi:V-type proton ATPase subunit a2 [Dictyocoela muelleri]|nr:V-type proton ATPase subunit a2 [Dictyocoela muelleri]